MYSQTDYFVNTLVPSAISFEKELTLKAEKTFSLNGYSREELQPIFEEACMKAKKENILVERIHHPLDNLICALFVPTYKKLLICKTILDQKQADKISTFAKDEANDTESALKNAQKIYMSAHQIHNQKEAIYMDEMDFELSDILCNALISRLLRGKEKATFESGKVINRFFGAPLISGNIDYIDALTSSLQKRYLIQGRPGCGKSTFLKKIAGALNSAGIDTENYHCSMDPESLDMVISRELSVALFDCTPPHQHSPITGKDEIIDLYKECLPPDIDEKNQEFLSVLDAKYKLEIQKGKDALIALAKAEKRFYEKLPQSSQIQMELLKNKVLTFLFFE